MPRRRTIGSNPLDTVIPLSAETLPRSAGPPPAQTESKARVTFHLPESLVERARNAVFWTPGLTLAGLAAIALQETLDALETQRGTPFPVRHSELKSGRPIKA